MQEMRAMLDKLNIGSVTPAITSSPSNTVRAIFHPKGVFKKQRKDDFIQGALTRLWICNGEQIEPVVAATSTQEPLSRCVRTSTGKPPSAPPINGCLANGARASGLSRPSIMPNGRASLCISSPSELQYSPSGSSSASSSFEERCQSVTPHSIMSSQTEIPSLVAVSYPFAPIPFPWRPTEVSSIPTTSNGVIDVKEVGK